MHSPAEQVEVISFLKPILFHHQPNSAWQLKQSTSEEAGSQESVPLCHQPSSANTNMGIQWTQKPFQQFSRALFLPQTISCQMHSLQFTYKIKKQCWPHVGPFFVCKRNNLFLKFSIKIHICIIIHFKAIREEWERSKESCTISPPFLILNGTEERLLELSFGKGAERCYSSSWFCTPWTWGGEKKRWNIYERTNETLQIPMFSYKQLQRNNYLNLFFKKHFFLTISKTSFCVCVIPCSFKWQH